MVLGGKSERLFSRESESKQGRGPSPFTIQHNCEPSTKTYRSPSDHLSKLKEASNQSWTMDWSMKMKQFLGVKPTQGQQK